MRDRAFVRLVQHAYKTVPYYRQLMDEHGISPDSVRSLSDLQRFPPLTKDAIKKAGEDLRSTTLAKNNVLVRRSGGTTGEPIRSYIDPLARALETYSFLRGYQWMGWKPGTRMVHLGHGSLGLPDHMSLYERIKHIAMSTHHLPAFSLNQATAPYFLDAVAKSGSCVLVGFASNLFMLACYAEELGSSKISVEQVFTTGEFLPPDWRARIAKVFGCSVKSYYGSGEVNSLGYQKEEAGPYIIPDEHVVVESQVVGGSSNSSETPSLLVTPLYNYAQPLIRFQNGDCGQVAPPGTHHPTRSAIYPLEGRSADFFVSQDGTMISSMLGTLIIEETQVPVRIYQFIQINQHTVEFRYEPDLIELSESELDEVKRILQRYLGLGLIVKFHATSDFLLSPLGKHRIMIRQDYC